MNCPGCKDRDAKIKDLRERNKRQCESIKRIEAAREDNLREATGLREAIEAYVNDGDEMPKLLAEAKQRQYFLAAKIRMAIRRGKAATCTGCETENGIVCGRCGMLNILTHESIGEILTILTDDVQSVMEELKADSAKLREDLRLERLKSKGLNDYAEFLEMPSLECYMRLDGLYHATLTGCEGTIDAVGEEHEDALRNLYKKLQKRGGDEDDE